MPKEKKKPFVEAVQSQKVDEYISDKIKNKLIYIDISQEMSNKIPELTFSEVDPDIAVKWHASEQVAESDAWSPKKRKKPAISTGRTMIWPFLIKTEKTNGGVKLKLYHVYQNYDKFLAHASGLEDYEVNSIIARIKEVIRSGGTSETAIEESM